MEAERLRILEMRNSVAQIEDGTMPHDQYQKIKDHYGLPMGCNRLDVLESLKDDLLNSLEMMEEDDE